MDNFIVDREQQLSQMLQNVSIWFRAYSREINSPPKTRKSV